MPHLETKNQDNKISNSNPHYLQVLLVLRAENQRTLKTQTRTKSAT